MSHIKIDDLHPTGSELFSGSESYMNELSDSELDVVSGGTASPSPAATPAISAASAVLNSAAQRVTQYTPPVVQLTDKALNGPTGIALCGDFTTFLG